MTGGDTEVLIVGGGAAGIAAGRCLQQAGVRCLLVEARSRLGGRAWTVREPNGASDLGCGWLHSADRNPFVGIAEEEGCTIDRTVPPWTRPAIPANFPAAEQAAFREAMTAFHERLDDHDFAGGDLAAASLLDPGNRWNPLIDAISTYYSGAELARVSGLDLQRYDDSGVNGRVVEGYGAAIVRHAAGLPVQLDCHLSRIDHGGARLRAETSLGTITADAAVITLPSSLLAQERIRFDPPLPDKVEAASQLPLGLADKLFLQLDGAQEFDADCRLFGRTDTAATATYHLRPFARPTVEVYYGGALAAELEAEGESALFDFARTELVGALGSAFARRVRPIAAHLWGTDPLARGSYSFARPGCADARRTLAAPVDDRLFFAGEACSVRDFSTAHGAYLTGRDAAGALIAALSARG